MLCIGIIGNFSGHLSKAENVEEGALPSGIFVIDTEQQETLTHSPELHYPSLGSHVDIEPEFVLRCKIGYERGIVASIMPTHISIGNDMTIRQLEGSEKISERKSWGYRSKGINSVWWNVSRLSPSSYDESLRLISYIERGGHFHLATPEINCTELKVFYCHLMAWLVEQINGQETEGMFDQVLPSVQSLGYPTDLILYTGAPNYSEWGEQNFVQRGDRVHIAAYNANLMDSDLIQEMFVTGELINSDAVLSFSQTVV